MHVLVLTQLHDIKKCMESFLDNLFLWHQELAKKPYIL